MNGLVINEDLKLGATAADDDELIKRRKFIGAPA